MTVIAFCKDLSEFFLSLYTFGLGSFATCNYTKLTYLMSHVIHFNWQNATIWSWEPTWNNLMTDMKQPPPPPMRLLYTVEPANCETIVAQRGQSVCYWLCGLNMKLWSCRERKATHHYDFWQKDTAGQHLKLTPHVWFPSTERLVFV